ncbi:conserved hypothetical protein [Xanthomonas citri pv. citri]|nr:conserved hypothetical protein [Xanthomonas citri pv. citri]
MASRRALQDHSGPAPGLKIGLQGRADQLGFGQGGIARLPLRHEGLHVHAVAYVDVASPLRADTGLMRHRAPARAIVVADEHAGALRQRVQALDRRKQLAGIAAREIATRRARIRHEQRVARKQRIADQIRNAVAGVAGHRDDACFDTAKLEALVIGEQMIELRAIGTEVVRQCVLRGKGSLHLANSLADADARLRPVLLQPLRRRQVIGMRMGFQQPLQLPSVLLDGGKDALRRLAADDAALGRVVQRRVDHRRRTGGRIGDHIGEGVAVGMKEGKYLGLHRRLHVRGWPVPR